MLELSLDQPPEAELAGAMVVSEAGAIAGVEAGAIVVSEAGAIAAADEDAGAIAGVEAGAMVVSEAGAIGAADDASTLEDAAVTTGVAGGRLKIQIRPMMTITATMMMIQVLRFMQETLGC